MLTKSAILLMLALLFGACSGRHVSVLAIGTSITQGDVYAPGSYRAPLSGLLHRAGYEVQFMGTYCAPTDPVQDTDAQPFDCHAEGHSGATTKSLASNLYTFMPASMGSDYILVEIGITDFHTFTPAYDVAAGIKLDISHLRSFNATATILLHEVFHVSTPEDILISDLNPMLPAICAGFEPCQVLHDASLLTDTDKVDPYHPNAAGHAKLAQFVFDAMGLR